MILNCLFLLLLLHSWSSKLPSGLSSFQPENLPLVFLFLGIFLLVTNSFSFPSSRNVHILLSFLKSFYWIWNSGLIILFFQPKMLSHFFLLPSFLMRNAQPLNTWSFYMQRVVFVWLLSSFSLIFQQFGYDVPGPDFFHLSCWGLLSFLILQIYVYH